MQLATDSFGLFGRRLRRMLGVLVWCVVLSLSAVAPAGAEEPNLWNGFDANLRRSLAEFDAARKATKPFSVAVNRTREEYWMSAPGTPAHAEAGAKLVQLLLARDLWLLDEQIGFHPLYDVASYGGARASLREGDVLMPNFVGNHGFERWTEAVRAALKLPPGRNPLAIDQTRLEAALRQTEPVYAQYFSAMMEWEQMSQCGRKADILRVYADQCEKMYREGKSPLFERSPAELDQLQAMQRKYQICNEQARAENIPAAERQRFVKDCASATPDTPTQDARPGRSLRLRPAPGTSTGR